MTYQAAKMVKDSLKVSAFQYSTAIGQALAFGAGRAMGAPGEMMSAPGRAYGMLGNLPGGFGDRIRAQQQAARAQVAAHEKNEVSGILGDPSYKAGLKSPNFMTRWKATKGK